jgi:hypothetical protein
MTLAFMLDAARLAATAKAAGSGMVFITGDPGSRHGGDRAPRVPMLLWLAS